MENEPRLHVMDHTLIRHKLTLLRDITTGSRDFRQIMKEVTFLIGYEALRNLPMRRKQIETPLTKTAVGEVLDQEICLVPILRAGLGLTEAMLTLLPNACVGYLGLSRDETTLKPTEYYCKMPGDLDKKMVIILDPILATGGSMIAAVSALKKRGAEKIISLNLLASPEGCAAALQAHHDIEIYLGAMEEYLDNRGFILPGMGDAGDRLFGTP